MLPKSSPALFRGIGGAFALRAKQRCCPRLLDAFSKRTGLESEIRVSVATDADFVRSRLSRLVLYALIATSFSLGRADSSSVGRRGVGFRSSGGLSVMQPSAVVVPPYPEAVSALP